MEGEISSAATRSASALRAASSALRIARSFIWAEASSAGAA